MPIHPFEPGHSGRWTLDAGCSTQPGQHRRAGQAHCLLQRLGCFMLGVMESAPCATFPLYDPPCLPALAPVCYVTIQPWLNALDTGRVCSWSLPHSRHHGGRKGRRRTQDAGRSSSRLSPPSSLFSLLSFSLSLFTLLSPFSLLCPLSPFSSFSFHRQVATTSATMSATTMRWCVHACVLRHRYEMVALFMINMGACAIVCVYKRMHA